MPDDDERVARIVATLKQSAATLRDAGIPFAVAGGLACWARGGPLCDVDVDLALCETDFTMVEGLGVVEPE